jgi:hypothetical protein
MHEQGKSERWVVTVEIRPARPGDEEACGRIIFEAFGAIADQHAFPRDFPSVEVATQLASAFIGDPSIFGVVAERDGKVVGSNFLRVRSEIHDSRANRRVSSMTEAA